MKQGIPVHALRLNTHSAFEADICSFKVGLNEMWFRDDDGGVFFTETVVSFVRNLLQLFPKVSLTDTYALFYLNYSFILLLFASNFSNHAMLQLTILATV